MHTGPTQAGNAFADFLIGIPSAVSQDAPVTAYTNTWYVALFMNDDFRVHPRVTLNLGLRWDVQTPPTDPQDRVVNYVPGLKSTVNPIAPVGANSLGILVWNAAAYRRLQSLFAAVGFCVGYIRRWKDVAPWCLRHFLRSISGNEWNTMTNFQPFSTRLTFPNINQKTNAQGVPWELRSSTRIMHSRRQPFPLQRDIYRRRRPFPGSNGFRVAPHLSDERFYTAPAHQGYCGRGSVCRDGKPQTAVCRDVNYPV
jgi:hypothetical protein